MALGEPQADGIDDTDEDIAEFDFFKSENRIFAIGLVFDADLDDAELLADIDRGDQTRFGDEFGFVLANNCSINALISNSFNRF